MSFRKSSPKPKVAPRSALTSDPLIAGAQPKQRLQPTRQPVCLRSGPTLVHHRAMPNACSSPCVPLKRGVRRQREEHHNGVEQGRS